MKKSVLQLLKVASKFQKKYAQGTPPPQSLKEILQNAASYGEQSANGIMNFPAKLKEDKADLIFSVIVNSGLMGLSVEVTEPRVDPPQYAGNYARLPEQVKNYLDRHIKNFPQIPRGQTVLEYSGKDKTSPGIARIEPPTQ